MKSIVKIVVVGCVLLFVVAACAKNRRPGLSDIELFAPREYADTTGQADKEQDSSDTATYVVPAGIKYAELRAVDPANPPVVLDVADRNLNIRKFDLSDYYTQVRYIKLKHPAKEGYFLVDTKYHVTQEQGSSSGTLQSNITFMGKDSIIAGDVFFGYHSYDMEGNFLHTLNTFDFPKNYDASKNEISYNESDFKKAIGGGATKKNNNRFSVDDETMASYVYNRTDTTSNDFLFTFSLKGDTLCRFANYNPKPDKTGQPISGGPQARIYVYEGKITIRQEMNDTVYRLNTPNRLLPAYVLNMGAYKLDISLADDFSNKFFLDKWRETDKYVLFTYNQNYDSHNNREKGLVRFFYSYYDKNSRQFYHFCEGTTTPEQEFLIENSIPDALPFMLSYTIMGEGFLIAYYSKARLEKIITNKDFASLSPELQNKLKTTHNDLAENEVLIMTLR